MKSLAFTALCLVLFVQASFAQDSLRSLIEFDTDLPEDANLDHLLKEPSKHTPFSYHQEFMKDANEDYPFSYDPNHHLGPSNWKHHFEGCGGDLQSPIHIRTQKCEAYSFKKPLMYPRSDKQPTKVTLENNGYSVGWSFEYNGTRPHLAGGPLKSSYVLETMHMHWSKNGGSGSEHFVDGESADLEIHLIHRNVKYATFTEAAANQDGLVVIGMLTSVSRNVKPFQMFKNLNDIREPQSSVVLTGRPKGYILRNIVGFVPDELFVMYRGGLTTPPCSEATLWLVAKRVRKISFDDMAEIRKIKGNNNSPMGPNNRPIQKSNNRPCILFKMPKQI